MSALRLAGAVFDADGTLFDTERLALEVWLGVAREILEYLSEKGLPLALATSSGANTTRYKLENSGLGRYFRAVVTGDMVTRGKPDPEIYLNACRAIGADPARTLGVEDSKNGVLSAHRAGLMTALVPDLIPPTPEMEGAAFGVFDSLNRLQSWLKKALA